MTRHAAKPFLATCLLVLVLAGCGPFSSPDESSRVKQVVSEVFTRNDPDICTDRVTAAFLQRTYDGTPETAVDDCLRSQDQRGNAAREVEFASVRIDGGRAVATVKVTGGPLDGRMVVAGLVQQFGWRLDSLTPAKPPPSPKKVRRAADAALRKGLIELQGFKPGRADCFVRFLRRHVSDAELAEDLKALHRGEWPASFAIATRRCKGERS